MTNQLAAEHAALNLNILEKVKAYSVAFTTSTADTSVKLDSHCVHYV